MKENISLWQLFILVFLFLLGSSIVVNIGVKAERDAWIAILIACISGLFLVFNYLQLLKWFPSKNLFEILEECLGKWLGGLLGIIYVTFFFLLASFVLRDFGELMVSSIFLRTPIEFISITMIFLIVYIVYLGIEVLGRITEIFIPYAVVFLLFLGVGVLFSGTVEFKNILPILGEGVTPVLTPVFEEIIHFPFGEFIAFMVIIPHVSKFKYAAKTSVIAYLLAGIFLVYSSLLQITTLGVLKERVNFPLLSTARQISLLNFIERVDLLIVFIMMLGIIVKASVLLYGGLKGLEKIFKRPYRDFAFPMGMLIALYSILIGEDYYEYIMIGGKILTVYIQTFLQIIVPISLLAIAFFIKKKVVKKSESN
ncbi:GerAB/ArcD/ProY family transporter [Neobacillus sp. D3-1R]|uniref:GerAB/ArcD/ProY family transporter n=1 Tax=Neobacillus sp. D3-1R TaxID=3445778 RepID=UPI003F9FF4BA